MAQYTLFQVTLPTEGVDQLATLTPRHRVDRQITTRKVFFKGNTGVKIDIKSMVAMPLLPFGTGQGVFLARFGMQENGKRGAHLAKITMQQFIRCAANHEPVFFLVGHAQESITDSPADQVNRAAHFNAPARFLNLSS